MNKKNGFVISSARNFERSASSEVYYALTELLGYDNVTAYPIKKISGLSLAFFGPDSVHTLQLLSDLVESDPSIFRYTLKLVPFQYEISSSLDNFAQIGSLFSSEIGSEQKWKILLRRRHTQLDRKSIISSIATNISSGKVDLENPDLIIFVEVIGQWSYVALSPFSELSLSQYIQEQEFDDFSF